MTQNQCWIASGVIFAVIMAAVTITAQMALEARLGYDYRIINPVAQGIGLLAAFLSMWPVELKYQPGRRVNSFGQFALYMTGIVALITAVRLGIHMG